MAEEEETETMGADDLDLQHEYLLNIAAPIYAALIAAGEARGNLRAVAERSLDFARTLIDVAAERKAAAIAKAREGE